MPRASDVHEFLRRFTGAADLTDARTFVRSKIKVQFGQARPVAADLRDIRDKCCMIDVGNSIFTLAFDKIVDIVPPQAGETTLIRAQVGALACHAPAHPREQVMPYLNDVRAQQMQMEALERERREREKQRQAANERALRMWQESVLPPAASPPAMVERAVEEVVEEQRVFTAREIEAELMGPVLTD